MQERFKYRNYDYAIRRFMSIDPLAEKYPYNSTYAFQENKMGLGRELEGLELEARDEKTGEVSSGPINTSSGNFTEVQTTDEGWSEKLPEVTVTAKANKVTKTLKTKQITQQPVMMHEPTKAEIHLSKYYKDLHQQAINEQKNTEAMYLREPVFSGYYGGANQYPVISSAMFSLVSPDALLVEGTASVIETGANTYRAVNTWSKIIKMTGKGMTFAKKSKIYRNSLKISNQMLRVGEGIKNVSGADGTYSILRDSHNYYHLSKKLKLE